MQKVAVAQKSAVSRIVPVNMQTEKGKLDSKSVKALSAAATTKVGQCVSWACAAVRG
jgi:hypothetical protein